jgi:hypothetical protein
MSYTLGAFLIILGTYFLFIQGNMWGVLLIAILLLLFGS